MPDPSLVEWADGSLHHPAGGHHKESDPLISQLSVDARLPQEQDGDEQARIEKRLKLQADTSAKFMRAAHQAQTHLLRTRLFPCQDADGNNVPADPITSRDPVSLQILKRLAKQVQTLENTPLEEDETELERGVKIGQILSLMSKQEAIMEQNINKAVGLGTRANQEAAKLQFAMKAHKEKMEAARGGLDAAEVERIADA